MPTPNKTYLTLKELREAYASGELHKRYKLHVEMDRTYVPAVPVGEEERDIFQRNPFLLLEEALTLLGIPWTT